MWEHQAQIEPKKNIIPLHKVPNQQGEVGVEYCPTENIWAEVLNKPKQGKIFKELIWYLMGL